MVVDALYIFHRDLRLVDNKALDVAGALQYAGKCRFVYPVFIMPDDQILKNRNAFFSDAAVQFMFDSLESLDADMRIQQSSSLTLLRGASTASVVKDVLTKVPSISRVIFNADETPYAVQRDRQVAQACASVPGKKNRVECIAVLDDANIVTYEDALYNDLQNNDKKSRPYTVFSQFYARLLPLINEDDERAKMHEVTFKTLPPVSAKASKRITFRDTKALYTPLARPVERGGREHGLAALRRAAKMCGTYGDTRDVLSKDTSRLSMHLRFGTVSIREAYAAARSMACGGAHDHHHELQRQLAFREFYRKGFVAANLLTNAFRKDLDAKIPWRQPRDDPKAWGAWTVGRTGFPLVDAGIRELLSTGFMHNRARMVVASFATRYLLFDWRACARFFYTKLCDADPISNTAGWQWAAGVGMDSPPPFRRPLNPFRQSEKFDKDAIYIRRHLPAETRDITDARDLHRWDDIKVRAKYRNLNTCHVKLVDPIVDARTASNRALDIWKRAASASK
jgi:deoxyribodipyrimidine photo-lyase